jgi:hypothetical protein
MHVHTNQINPNAQLDALYAAEKAAAQREAARTRKKLLEFASVLAGEVGEPCVVKLGAHEESQEQSRRQTQQGQIQKNQNGSKSQQERVDSGDLKNSISDWA